MIVYTVETIGEQITSYEANKENLPKFLEKPVKESFKKYGFCMWKTPEYECIIYPTLQAAQHAIQWTIETKNLSYNVTKFYVENGITYKMNVRIKNGVCDWSITADIYEKRRNGRFVWCVSSCCHEEILKRFPEFKTFIDLHLCNHYGQPMYPVENGLYHLKNSDKEKTINYLRNTIHYVIVQRIRRTLHTYYIP